MCQPQASKPKTNTATATVVIRLLKQLQLWQQRQRSRRQLAQLDPRQLADSGISQAERLLELDKPFWR
jgi:uncharacterized protein YjiS (DUF1127 family)